MVNSNDIPIGDAVRRLNPDVFHDDPRNALVTAKSLLDKIQDAKSKKRIRQDGKPLMNKLESEWFNILSTQFPNYPRPRAQAKRYRIGNGAWYKPDITASCWPVPMGPARETAWECKGPKDMKNVARGVLALKSAASQWPEVRFVMVWRVNGLWHEQEILP